MRQLVAIEGGHVVLDVGCGLGAGVIELAERGPAQCVIVGIDIDQGLLASAASSPRAAGLVARPHFIQGDAHQLPLPTACADVCLSERLLQHVSDSQSVVAEMARVVKPGGRVQVVDTDWATLSIDSVPSARERQIVGSIAEHLANAYAGRELPRLLSRAGLVDITVDVVPVHWRSYELFRITSFMAAGIHEAMIRSGDVSLETWRSFERQLATADRKGEFFASACLVAAIGKKPGARPELSLDELDA